MNYKGPYHDKELNITQSMRERIYEDIWSEALYKVAQKYNLTSAPLKRRCKECWDIPVPDSSYWARVHAGKKEKRPELPMPPAEFARPYLSEYAVSYIQLNDVPEADLYTKEPMSVFSEKTKQLVAEAEKNLKTPTTIIKPTYDFARTIESEKIEAGSTQYRGLCILYALSAKAREFEGEGYLGDANTHGHLFSGHITLCRQNWCYHMNCDPNTEMLSLSFYWSEWAYEYDKDVAAYRMIFVEKENLPLDQQIGAVFHALMVESGRKVQEDELARRADIIKKANAERAKKLKPFIDEENKKAEKALNDANAYLDAQKIRAFAAAFYEKNSPLFESHPGLKERYEWLQKRADWLDPLIENDYDRFLSPE
ncbi:MAG: hypothetical protein E7474_01750 [Ruminococcaceae bacterium]|nr:hypothetical protein [Oscillospiraceae bacterium]